MKQKNKSKNESGCHPQMGHSHLSLPPLPSLLPSHPFLSTTGFRIFSDFWALHAVGFVRVDVQVVCGVALTPGVSLPDVRPSGLLSALPIGLSFVEIHTLSMCLQNTNANTNTNTNRRLQSRVAVFARVASVRIPSG